MSRRRSAAERLTCWLPGMAPPEPPASGVRTVPEVALAVAPVHASPARPDVPHTDGVACMGLVRDERKGAELERRRRDCAYLGAAEEAWIASGKTGQSRCPERCPGYTPQGLVTISAWHRGGLAVLR